MENEDLSEFINFISLQENIKQSKSSLNEKKNTSQKEKNDEDEDEENELTYPVNVPSSTSDTGSSSIESKPTQDDVKKLGQTALQAPKAAASTQASPLASFSGSLTPTQMAAMGYATNTVQSARTRSAGVPVASPQVSPLRSMVGGLQRMPIAASYDPFSSNKEELTENVKLIRKRVLSLLNKEPHKTEINKMRSEISGE
jgi:hypothetical protein